MSSPPSPARPWWRKKRWWAVGLLVLLLLPPVSVATYSHWIMNRHAVPPSTAARLRPGMTDADVRDLLGEPQFVFPQDDGGKEWTFDRGPTTGLHLQFDSAGRLVSHWED